MAQPVLQLSGRQALAMRLLLARALLFGRGAALLASVSLFVFVQGAALASMEMVPMLLSGTALVDESLFVFVWVWAWAWTGAGP